MNTLKLKLAAAKKYLGTGWVLHPQYVKCHWHTPRHHGSHLLFDVLRRARNLGRIE